MSRHVAAVAVVLCLSPMWLHAQTVKFTVNVASADVHKYPSIGSPVIAQAQRGRVLEVRRELGSWVAIPWPGGENGLAYLHVSTGSMARATTPPPATRTAAASSSTQVQPRAIPPKADQVPPRPATPSANQVQVLVMPPSHVVGLGMRLGASTMGIGASARGWRQDRFGFQVTLSHAGMTSSLVPEQLSSTEIEPSVMYAMKDRLTDYVWIRPFLGSGVNFHHRSLKVPGATVDSSTDTGLGAQAFGGAEFAFSAAAKFAVSTDVSYHWSGSEIPGYDLGGLGFSMSGHWYIK